MTNLNNMIKENQYKNNSGIKQDDEKKIDLTIVKRALEGNPSQAQKSLKSSSKSEKYFFLLIYKIF